MSIVLMSAKPRPATVARSAKQKRKKARIEMHQYFEDVGRLPDKHLCSICGYGPQSEYHFLQHEFINDGTTKDWQVAKCLTCGYHPAHSKHFHYEPPKQLLVKEVIDRYPRMLGLLKAAEMRLLHGVHGHHMTNDDCVKCQIQALLKEIEK